jgi:hypothetical protein
MKKYIKEILKAGNSGDFLSIFDLFSAIIVYEIKQIIYIIKFILNINYERIIQISKKMDVNSK